MKEQIYKGYFYNIDNPDNKIAGETIIEGGQISLNLFEPIRIIKKLENKPGIIKGEVEEGTILIFLDGDEGLSHPFKELNKSIRVRKMIFSHEEIDGSEIKFKKFRLSFVRLRDFINKSKLKAGYKTKEVDGKNKIIGFSAEALDIDEPILTDKSKSKIKQIDFRGNYSFQPLTDDSEGRNIEIHENPSIDIEFNDPVKIKILVDYYSDIKSLMTFILKDNIYHTALSGSTDKKQSVTFYFASIPTNSIDKSDQFSIMFNLFEINNEIGFINLLEKWKKSKRDYYFLYRNYEYLIKHKDMPLQMGLIGSLTSLESYINLKYKNKKDLNLVDKYKLFIQTYKGKYQITEKDIILMKDLRHALAHGKPNLDELIENSKKSNLFRKIFHLCDYAILQSLDLSDNFIETILNKPYL